MADPAHVSITPYLNTPIWLDPKSGKFYAIIGRATIERAKLADLQAEIRRRSTFVRAFATSYGSAPDRPREIAVIGYSSGDFLTRDDGKYDTGHVFRWDDAKVAELNALADEYDQLRARWRKATEDLYRTHRLDPEAVQAERRQRQAELKADPEPES
jgi:hypothetical protein